MSSHVLEYAIISDTNPFTAALPLLDMRICDAVLKGLTLFEHQSRCGYETLGTRVNNVLVGSAVLTGSIHDTTLDGSVRTLGGDWQSSSKLGASGRVGAICTIAHARKERWGGRIIVVTAEAVFIFFRALGLRADVPSRAGVACQFKQMARAPNDEALASHMTTRQS